MAVHIEIDDKTAIESSSTCWQISRKNTNKKTGEITWVASKFYNSFESCLQAIMEMSVRDSNAKTVSELVNAYRAASSRLSDVCAPLRNKNALGGA